jgi:hypothetical protein
MLAPQTLVFSGVGPGRRGHYFDCCGRLGWLLGAGGALGETTVIAILGGRIGTAEADAGLLDLQI